MPKFSEGQIVQATINNHTAGLTKGSTYEVLATSLGSTIRITNDRGVKRWVQDAAFETYVTKKAPANAPTLAGKRWIISMIENGVLKPASEPRQYASEKQAHAVAKEMAEKHRGTVFVVFEATGFTFVPTSSETVVHAL